jgi:hypothetical protein
MELLIRLDGLVMMTISLSLSLAQMCRVESQQVC